MGLFALRMLKDLDALDEHFMWYATRILISDFTGM